ncbi:MAG: putative sulfate exporter family transporter [Flavobacteriaceae bacterium]|nr:putative sulfate exporter family transporter [Flavobacteriaceae bacterium]
MTFPKLEDNKSRIAAASMGLSILAIPMLGLHPHHALAIGLLLGLTVGNPLGSITKPLTKKLLQFCVVGLGFGMDINQVAKAGSEGFLFTVATIVGALMLGLLLGKVLGVSKKVSYLISAGTAICGGSAIAAVSPVLDADEKEISVAMATVFALNAVALLVFPYIGEALQMTQQQFGLWSAIAIHDTSSVVGASIAYGGDITKEYALTIKLARALWIIPLVIGTSLFYGKKAGVKAFPVFILFFIFASVANTYLHLDKSITTSLVNFSKMGLSITLLFIGAGISLKSLKEVGLKALAQGFILWVILLVSTLLAVLYL